jgi:hypothetical protein
VAAQRLAIPGWGEIDRITPHLQKKKISRDPIPGEAPCTNNQTVVVPDVPYPDLDSDLPSVENQFQE